MKRILIFYILFFAIDQLYSQINAITLRVEKVILFNDSTWTFTEKMLLQMKKIKIVIIPLMRKNKILLKRRFY